jgi:hypothetical protein
MMGQHMLAGLKKLIAWSLKQLHGLALAVNIY